jgi:hypothetical protein
MNPIVTTQNPYIPRESQRENQGENKNTIQENNEILSNITRTIQPVVDIRLDIRKILDKEYLFTLPPSFAAHQAENLLLTTKEKDPPKGSMVWLRMSPPGEERCPHYEIADPEANDLIKSNRVFCKIKQLPNRIAILEDLTAPSFTGKKAVSLIWNLMAIASIKNMIFVDGSTTLGCCEEGALTSLHLTEVFLKGKSWYMSQGASSKISKIAFKTLVEEAIFGSYAKALTEGEIEDSRISPTIDYDRFSERMLAVWLPEFETSVEAYQKARRFLHHLPVTHLANCISQLVTRYPSLQSLQAILQQADKESTTMGTLFQIIRDKDSREHQADTHKLLHAYRDCFVSNKDSVFFQYIVDILTQNQVSSRCCSLAFLVLNHICSSLQLLQVDTKEIMQIIQQLLKSPEAASQQAEKLGNLTKKCSAKFLEYLEDVSGRDPPLEKVFNHSTHISREKLVQYRMETGISNAFLAAQTAIQYLANIPFSSLEEICPELVQKIWAGRSSSCDTLGALLKSLESDDAAREKIFLELLSGSIKYFSSLSIPLLNAYFTGECEEESIYELLMIAKHLCEKKNSFALVWPY